MSRPSDFHQKFAREVFEKIHEINKKHKTTIVIVEHNIKSVLDIADRGYVLDKGKIVESGTHQELLQLENGLYKHLSALQFEF